MAEEILTPEVMEGFLESQRRRGIGPASLEAYRRNLKKLYDSLPGEKRLTAETGRVWKRQMEAQGVAPRSVNSRLSALNSLCEYLGRREFQIHDFLREEAVLQPELTRAEDLRLLMDMMYRVLREDRPGCEALCHHLTLALLGSILQLTGDAPRRDRTETEPKTLGRQVQAFIDGHFSEPLTLQDMGKALHVSPYYLSHVFKEASGYSPTQYLLRRRIGEAQNLLISTDLPMAKIAEQVGFETQNYFNLQFSKHVGMPPGKYRESFVGKKKP